jgi:HEAT repeat protein
MVDTNPVSKLIEALNHEKRQVRLNAAEELAQIGKSGMPEIARDAIPVLAERLLWDESAGVRWKTAIALGHIKDSATVSALKTALRDKSHKVRESAAWALGLIGAGAKDAVPELMMLLSGNTVPIRSKAATALGRIGDPTAVPALKKALRDEFKSVYHRVAAALRKIGTPEAIRAVEDFDVEAYDDEIIREAMRHMGGKGNLVQVYE